MLTHESVCVVNLVVLLQFSYGLPFGRLEATTISLGFCSTDIYSQRSLQVKPGPLKVSQ